ncbi:hypothetical protein FPV67DRAFT_1692457 [Lyophyllum atratum]|nr:hypothetical protein FPV67DRAFT_1692457 [Lyophyllum atratum]
MGPRRLCVYVNNYNPTVLHSTRADNDMKLIPSGADTKDIAWYITSYAAKKQHKTSNAAALLAKRVKLHMRQEKHVREFVNANKRLITRCANALSRDHEFSAPEVISYLMDWGDRYESHHYVSIYWNDAMAALKRAYPALRSEL